MTSSIIATSLGVVFTFALANMAFPQEAKASDITEKSGFIWHVGRDDDPRTAQSRWFVSNFAIRNPQFRTAWSRRALQVDGDALTLALHPTSEGHRKDFIGGELQRRHQTHYGRYEVEMVAARGEGVISSFFTYTGPYFGDPHDEIDFEFLGRDTTKVWLNRFADGKKLPGQWIDLGFDAADAPHLYAFEWTPDEIAWYADGRELLRIHADETAIPSNPGKVYINIWAGGPAQRNWSGEAPPDQIARARYSCMSYQPMGAETAQCSDRAPE